MKVLGLLHGDTPQTRPESNNGHVVGPSGVSEDIGASTNISIRISYGRFPDLLADGFDTAEVGHAASPKIITAGTSTTPPRHLLMTEHRDHHPVTAKATREDQVMYPVANMGPHNVRFAAEHQNRLMPSPTIREAPRTPNLSRNMRNTTSIGLGWSERPRLDESGDRVYPRNLLSPSAAVLSPPSMNLSDDPVEANSDGEIAEHIPSVLEAFSRPKPQSWARQSQTHQRRPVSSFPDDEDRYSSW